MDWILKLSLFFAIVTLVVAVIEATRKVPSDMTVSDDVPEYVRVRVQAINASREMERQNKWPWGCSVIFIAVVIAFIAIEIMLLYQKGL